MIAAVVLQVAAGIVAGYGAWRCMELQRFGRDRRLMALAWFFGLFAASVLAHAVWEVQIHDVVRPDFAENGSFPQSQQGPRGGFGDRPFLRPEGTENVTILLFAHHLLMAGALGLAVVAFGRKRPSTVETTGAAAVVSLAFFSNLVPLLLGLEAALTLYLAVRALVNHMERKTPGALQVAIGFLLFFIGHLLFFVSHRPGRGRDSIGDVLALVGIILLVQVLPGRRN